MIELHNISKTLGAFSLTEIAFQVERGAYFALLGPSGAGKSVLLEIIAGLHRPDGGSLRCDGRDITTAPIQARGFGLVYQDQSLFPHMSVRRNIAYPLKSSPAEVEALAGKTGVSHLLDRRASTLSVGEAQRTALARALAARPRLLLLDEPMASLDAPAKTGMRTLLRTLNREGMTIIHVTHDYPEALSLAGQLAVLENGRIAQTGTPAEMFDHPSSAFIAGFTGIRNFHEGSLRRISSDIARFRTGELEFEVATDAADAHGYLMLRTEDISLANHAPASSIRNCRRGTVVDIEPVRLGVEVTVDIGVPLTALITQESAASLGIKTGRPVWINFKATAARFLPGRD